ncbi:hypothetical protein [Magnetofaba australis]|uniref:RND transporter n=1 Tax=Magnetofaba australis IT-1 TaxID=1434232 RepID=A0A1Y2K7A4_9PROT|nr:hypothetical protein [Magnetofaba australis]OSM06209.1 hypothetical protein MAIT1_01188 [Magnetofaba australis IT-1]
MAQQTPPLIWRVVDSIDWPILIFAALFLGSAPMHPEPHLVEKLRMLASGTLSRPIDIFDLVMHATPVVLVLLKAYRQFVMGGAAKA